MRSIWFILILMLSAYSYGQEVYTSPLTQHLPGMEIESINRVINFSREIITITTETYRGEDVQMFRIVQKEIRYLDPIGETLF